MGLSVFLGALGLRFAARKYARRLRLQLIHDYGASETYTEAQIRQTIRKLKLPERYIKLWFSAFMSEPEFMERFDRENDYALLRNLYFSFIPYQPTGELGETGAYRQSATTAGSGLD